MIEKLLDYWKKHTPITIFCCMNNIIVKLDNLQIEDIVQYGHKIKVYFNEDDFISLNPSEYAQDETRFTKENGDYISFIGEVELC